MVISPALISAGCTALGLRFALREKWAGGLTRCNPFWVSPSENMAPVPSACQPRSLLGAQSLHVISSQNALPLPFPRLLASKKPGSTPQPEALGLHLDSELCVLFPNRTLEGSRINIVSSSGCPFLPPPQGKHSLGHKA